jgi:hypothetical protein
MAFTKKKIVVPRIGGLAMPAGGTTEAPGEGQYI